MLGLGFGRLGRPVHTAVQCGSVHGWLEGRRAGRRKKRGEKEEEGLGGLGFECSSEEGCEVELPGSGLLRGDYVQLRA